MSQMRQNADQGASAESTAFESWLARLRRDGQVDVQATLPDDPADVARQVDQTVDLPALFMKKAAAAGCLVIDTRGADPGSAVVELLAARDVRQVLLDERLAGDDYVRCGRCTADSAACRC